MTALSDLRELRSISPFEGFRFPEKPSGKRPGFNIYVASYDDPKEHLVRQNLRKSVRFLKEFKKYEERLTSKKRKEMALMSEIIDEPPLDTSKYKVVQQKPINIEKRSISLSNPRPYTFEDIEAEPNLVCGDTRRPVLTIDTNKSIEAPQLNQNVKTVRFNSTPLRRKKRLPPPPAFESFFDQERLELSLNTSYNYNTQATQKKRLKGRDRNIALHRSFNLKPHIKLNNKILDRVDNKDLFQLMKPTMKAHKYTEVEDWKENTKCVSTNLRLLF